MTTRYCEVALPVPLRSTFTYAVPGTMAPDLVPGCRVVVPFRRKAMIGVVLALGGGDLLKSAPRGAEIREVVEILDPLPALTPQLIELGRWVAGYYVAPVGEVFRAMLPPAVEVRHERLLTLTERGREHLNDLGQRTNRSEIEVTDLALLQLCEVQGKPVRWLQLRKLPGGQAAAERLLRRGCLEARESTQRTKARTQTIVAWAHSAASDGGEASTAAEAKLHEALTATRGPMPLTQALKLAGVTASVAKRLIREGKLQTWEEPLPTGEGWFDEDFTPPSNILNDEQQRALAAIEQWLAAAQFMPALLHGVTGSGKTEVYMRAVQSALARGRTVLLLVPEIALTLWAGRLFHAQFGERVAVLHSSLPDVERAREWWRVRRGEAQIVIGTRSAVFAPLENLGLVIVDEEQESSYKQEETPRYHGRDVAVVRAKLSDAVVVLGSATPSLETYHNARTGKYSMLRLESRVENRPLALVEVVDMREDFRATHHAAALSAKLREAMGQRLASGTQTLVLINRRGYSWFVLCRSCGAAVQCENCSISLTYHKRRDRLECHYCGFFRRVPKACPKCSSEYVYFFGEGAEQVEEKLRELLPAARIGRLDRDTVRTRREYGRVLGAFAGGQLDVLVGTQMVAKGHDFERVTLVGVVAADLSLSLPDFRAAERTFQLLTQVAGRAGRGQLPGEVLVQTFYPEHYAIEMAARQNYAAFFDKEVHFRRMMHYPPFTALANIIVRDRKIENAIRWSRALAAHLAPREKQGLKVLGPAAAPLARLKREYRFQFLLKSPKRALLTQALAGALDFCAAKEIPQSALLVDVDPVSLF